MIKVKPDGLGAHGDLWEICYEQSVCETPLPPSICPFFFFA